MAASATADYRERHASNGWGAFVDVAAVVKMAVLAGLFVLAFWRPIRDVLVYRWVNDDTWTYCWLVPVFSLYFIAGRRDELLCARRRTSLLGLVALSGALGLFALGIIKGIGYFQGVALVLTIIGLAWFLLGNSFMRILWFPLAFLMLAVPLPYNIYVGLTQPLQMLAARTASFFLSLIIPGLSAEQAGVRIDYFYNGESGSLHVDQGCSGMRTQMALLTLALVVAYTGERPVWQRLVMIAACVPIAIFVNVLRVAVTGWLQIHGYHDLASGTPHALLGIVLFFGVALSLLMLVGYVLKNLFVDVPAEE